MRQVHTPPVVNAIQANQTATMALTQSILSCETAGNVVSTGQLVSHTSGINQGVVNIVGAAGATLTLAAGAGTDAVLTADCVVTLPETGTTCWLRTHQAPVAVWAASYYGIGAIVSPSIPNGFVYKCTVTGETLSTEPAWPTELSHTVSDGGVTWMCFGQAGPFDVTFADPIGWQGGGWGGSSNLTPVATSGPPNINPLAPTASPAPTPVVSLGGGDVDLYVFSRLLPHVDTYGPWAGTIYPQCPTIGINAQEYVYVVAAGGAVQNLIDPSIAVGSDITLSENMTLVPPPGTVGLHCWAFVRQPSSGGSYSSTVTHVGVKWPKGAIPVMSTGAGAVDLYQYMWDSVVGAWCGVCLPDFS